jgi:Na+/phosphate symporter
MLKELALHLPFLVAIVIGGLTGRFLADRHLIKSVKLVFGAAVIVLVASIVGQSVLIADATSGFMLFFNALSGASIAFILTAFGGFEKASA